MFPRSYTITRQTYKLTELIILKVPTGYTIFSYGYNLNGKYVGVKKSLVVQIEVAGKVMCRVQPHSRLEALQHLTDTPFSVLHSSLIRELS